MTRMVAKNIRVNLEQAHKNVGPTDKGFYKEAQ